jgi:hypothetical protein
MIQEKKEISQAVYDLIAGSSQLELCKKVVAEVERITKRLLILLS